MYPLKVATAIDLPVFCHDSSGDAVTGLSDGGFTKRISKNGGAFAAMTVTITEMENGWYSLPLTSTHTNTSGILTITLTHASIKQVNLQFRVHNRINDDFAFPTVSGRSIDVTSPGQVGIDLDNVNGTLAKDTDITGFEQWTDARAGYLDNLNISENVAGTSEISALNNLSAADVNAEVDTALDTAIPATPTAGSVNERLKALDELLESGGSGDAAAIKAKTDNLPASPSDFDSTSDTVTVGTNNDKTGYTLSSTGVDSIFDELYETGRTLREYLRLASSVLFSKSSGGGTSTLVFRDQGDTQARVTATVDANGNRTAVTLDDT